MSVADHLLILHLSDLHFGNKNRFANDDLAQLGKAFHKAVDHARQQLELEAKVGLVIVSGDLVEVGKPAEFDKARAFLEALSGALGVEPAKFVFVPGNHEVSWPQCKKVAADQEEDGFDEAELCRRMNEVKFKHYYQFLSDFYGRPLAELPGRRRLAGGAWLHSFPDLRLSVVALNSCEKESHRLADRIGFMSTEQAQALIDAWRSDDEKSLLKIAAVHHNPIATTPANVDAWTKHMKAQSAAEPLAEELIDRYAADLVRFQGAEGLQNAVRDSQCHLVLHGHHHDQGQPIQWPWPQDGRTAILSTGSWGLKNDELPGDVPPSCQLILFDTKKTNPRLAAWQLVYNDRFRLQGEVLPGNFVKDPAGRNYDQPLPLPPSWTSPPKRSTRMRKAPLPEDLAAFLRTYRQRMSAAHERWDLRGLGVTAARDAKNQPVAPTLDQMYQPLRFDPNTDESKTDLGKVLDADSLLLQQRFLATFKVSRRKFVRPRGQDRLFSPLIIRAPAGAGKTTWVRHVFGQMLKKSETFPLMIVLRDVARHWQDPKCQGQERSIDQALEQHVAQYLGEGFAGRLERLLTDPQAPQPVLLVDGWDELGNLGDEFRQKLVGFLRNYPRLLVVVTSRPYGDSPPTHSDGFETLNIQPLSPQEISAFAERFYRVCYGADEQAVKAEQARFDAALANIPEAAALCRNPLMLTMMLFLSRSQPLPDKRHLLYRDCINNLLTARPRDREEGGALFTPDQWRPPDSEARMQALAALAYGLQTAGYKRLPSWESPVPIVMTVPELLALLPTEWKEEKRAGFLNWLLASAVLLTDRADNTLALRHLSFQEYLTAWHLNAQFSDQDQLIAKFRELAKAHQWWETLVIWAALLSGQNPERLTPIAQELMKKGSEEIVLVGMMMADGLGTESIFDEWSQRFVELLYNGWPFELESCLRAWSASQQIERRTALNTALLALAGKAINGIGWLRFSTFKRRTGLAYSLPFPCNAAASSVLEALCSDKPLQPEHLASGKWLCGGSPFWPGGQIGLLNLWPSRRRMAALSLQAGLICGLTDSDFQIIAQRELFVRTRNENLPRDVFRDIDHSFVRRVAGDVTRGVIRDVVRFFDCEIVRYVALNTDPNFVHYIDHDIHYGVVRTLQRPGPDVNRCADRGVARDLAIAFANEIAGVPPNYYRLNDLYSIYSSSWGRCLARSLLAQLSQNLEGRPAEVRLLSQACRISLDTAPGQPPAPLPPQKEHIFPLWAALARHLARQSSDEDKALLNDLAQHPEKCEGELSWGLQFIARGDLLMPDGSFQTLDDLCDRLGLPHLPYLEDLPPELVLDEEPK